MLTMLFRHLLEQNLNSLASRLTKLVPVPGAMSFPQKEHTYVRGIAGSPDLLCFSLSLPEHEYVLQPDGALHISGDYSPLVRSFQNADPHLDDFACQTCPA